MSFSSGELRHGRQIEGSLTVTLRFQSCLARQQCLPLEGQLAHSLIGQKQFGNALGLLGHAYPPATAIALLTVTP